MEMAIFITDYYKSPIGTIRIQYSDRGLSALTFEKNDISPTGYYPELEECKKQLDEYFAGKRREFNIPHDLNGTDFQKSVWNELFKIRFGQTISYSLLARKLGNIKTIRAVANANAKNPLSIVVPCHRVIGTGGNLTGYAGGLWRKKWLLDHEQQLFQMQLL
jgi:methylated-DNA-[protein]-cysteine S-methyltransferase